MSRPVLPRPAVLFEDAIATPPSSMVILADRLLVAVTVDGHEPPAGKRWGIDFTRPEQGHVAPYSGAIAGGPVAWGRTRMEIDLIGFALPTEATTPGMMAVGELALQAAAGGNQWMVVDVWSGDMDPDTGARIMIEAPAGNVWAYRINGTSGRVRPVPADIGVMKVVGVYQTLVQAS